ncbi:MAG: 50S ribosomal protein L22 [Candidatus Liptonbacteria bacterium RIFCSPLOWO2_01_FULL_45_15]|uniref:Large ribosomal subunit protein uL22 n=1 Tax=Candidatus Liptonbacteria bacterium RIFCSPLOWO2_01_FULL_45_15 TaxID=1798649 RepID=A0A1G2CC07_9BACT|nr:MAG: 50S ribosomal protein L22 [Candidatus Liptonbacteria bacterium RIFCSPLOWO2_01_FULL_45_15]
MSGQIKENKISTVAVPKPVSKKETAHLNYLRVTPRKARAIAGLLRGLSVNEAEAQLVMQNRRPAKPILKLLRSAVVGAVRNLHSSPDKLYIESIYVNQGPMLKRVLPRAKGVANPIQKKMSHVTIVLAENAGLKDGRFKMIIKKKVKKAVKKEGPKKEKKTQAEDRGGEQTAQRQSPGFFKKVFRRKSMV